VVFTIIPAVSNLHELDDSFRLLAAKFLDIGFPSDATAEGANFPINGDIFGNIQKFSETPNL
jgi:hypothetical protein